MSFKYAEWKRRKVLSMHAAQSGLCHWCRKLCFLPGEACYLRPNNGKLGGKAATLDHLYSRLNPLRHQKVEGPRHVMACSTCNNQRARAEMIRLNGTPRKRRQLALLEQRIGPIL